MIIERDNSQRGEKLKEKKKRKGATSYSFNNYKVA